MNFSTRNHLQSYQRYQSASRGRPGSSHDLQSEFNKPMISEIEQKMRGNLQQIKRSINSMQLARDRILINHSLQVKQIESSRRERNLEPTNSSLTSHILRFRNRTTKKKNTKSSPYIQFNRSTDVKHNKGKKNSMIWGEGI